MRIRLTLYGSDCFWSQCPECRICLMQLCISDMNTPSANQFQQITQKMQKVDKHTTKQTMTHFQSYVFSAITWYVLFSVMMLKPFSFTPSSIMRLKENQNKIQTGSNFTVYSITDPKLSVCNRMSNLKKYCQNPKDIGTTPLFPFLSNKIPPPRAFEKKGLNSLRLQNCFNLHRIFNVNGSQRFCSLHICLMVR